MKRFICVILVFTLFIACTVRPAYAVDVGTVSVALEAFISAALIGLGLSPQAGNNTAFNEIVTNCKNFLQEASIVAGDVMILLNPSPGMTYAKRDVIQKIKDWLFSSNTITYNGFSDSFSLKLTYYNKPFYGTSPIKIFFGTYVELGYRYFKAYALSAENFYFKDGSNTRWAMEYSDYNCYYSYYVRETSVKASSDDVPNWGSDWYYGSSSMDVLGHFASLVSSVSAESVYPEGIAISDVVPQVGEDIEITYIDWKELEKQVQEGDGSSEDPTDPTNPAPIPLIPYWPLWSPQFSDPDASLDDVTQQDVWTNGSDSSWDPSNSGENSESSPDTPSLTIDLRKFFPFCIPFDIYDIFVAFAADPVAPHFQWDIDLWDYTWSIDLDLSAWDEVAAILRRLELLAFIVGLGLVTRDKFLRG